MLLTVGRKFQWLGNQSQRVLPTVLPYFKNGSSNNYFNIEELLEEFLEKLLVNFWEFHGRILGDSRERNLQQTSKQIPKENCAGIFRSTSGKTIERISVRISEKKTKHSGTLFSMRNSWNVEWLLEFQLQIPSRVPSRTLTGVRKTQ